MAIYFFALLYWLLLFYIKRPTNKNFDIFLAVLPLFIITGLKAVSVGSDTISYYNRYVGAEYMMTADNTATEPGFNWLGYFFHDMLGISFYAFDALMAAFICTILALFLKRYSCNIYLSLFLYMTIGIFTMSMSGLRQTLAISLCMIPVIQMSDYAGLRYVPKRKKILRFVFGVLCVFAASTLHNSALIFLPILFLFNVRFSKRQTILLTIIATSTILLRGLLTSIMANFLPVRYEDFDLNMDYRMNVLILILPMAIGLFCSSLSKPDATDGKYSNVLSLMFIFLALQIVFNNLALNNSQLGRLGYYFMSSYIVLIPYTLSSIPQRNRSFITFAIVVLCLAFFYLGTNGGTLRIDNYKFFWQEPIYLNN